MYCFNCGKELSPGTKFCSGCGTPASQPLTASPTLVQEEHAPSADPRPEAAPPQPQKPHRSMKKLLLLIPVVIVVLAALAAFNFTALAARIAPDFALSRGFNKLEDDLSEQSESGPASILPILIDCLKDGTLSFSGELEDPSYGDTASVSGKLLTAKEGREIMLQDLILSDSYEEIGPIFFYLSNDAIAVRGTELTGDDNWYGIRLDCPLAEQNAAYRYLSPDETEALQSQLDILSDLLNGNDDPTATAIVKDLERVFSDFVDSAKPSVSSQEVRTGVSSTKATVLTYLFDTRDLSVLASNLFDVLLEEQYAEYLTNSYFSLDNYDSITDEGAEYFRSNLEYTRDEIVSYLRDDLKGNLQLNFALSSDGTLIQISSTADFEDTEYGESVSLDCSLSFGADPAKDGSIILFIQAEDSYDGIFTISLTCTTSGNGSGSTNQTIALNLASDSSEEENSIVLSTDWNPFTHIFSTTLTITDSGVVTARLSADGTLAVSSGSFALDLKEISYSDYDYWYDTLVEKLSGSLQLSAETGSSIYEPDFENLFDHEIAYYLF